MAHAIVDLRPKRPDAIFAGGRNFPEILSLEIKVSILPWRERFLHRILERYEIVKRAASLVVVSANCRFGEVKVTVTARVIAFAKQLFVLLIRKGRNMQPVRGAETHLHPEENIFLRPDLGKEIVALVQAQPMDRKRRAHAFADVNRETLGCDWPVFQRDRKSTRLKL